jgi:hypothetical protein
LEFKFKKQSLAWIMRFFWYRDSSYTYSSINLWLFALSLIDGFSMICGMPTKNLKIASKISNSAFSW